MMNSSFVKNTDSLIENMSVGILDEDTNWLKIYQNLYKDNCKTYKFIDQYSNFLNEANKFDVILIDLDLSDKEYNINNSSNILNELLQRKYRGKTFLISSNNKKYNRLGLYLNKNFIKNNPMKIFESRKNLKKLKELTPKLPNLPLINEIVSPFKDGKGLLFDGWSHPFLGLLNQKNCGVCHVKPRKGDIQPGFFVKEKVFIIAIDGIIEFKTSHDNNEIIHKLKPGEVEEIAAKSNHHSIHWKNDAEYLFISIPCWEGTPIK